MEQSAPHPSRPDPFTVLAIPFTFMINAAPEKCVEHLNARTKRTESWQQWGFSANWEQIDANTWRVYLQQGSRWQQLRTICYLKRDKRKSTRVSGYSEGNRKPFIYSALAVFGLSLLVAIVMTVSSKDASWLELPVITLVIALFTVFSRRRAARRFITTLNAVLSAD